MTHDPWRLDGRRARLQLPDFAAEIALDDLAAGVRSAPGAAWRGCLWSVRPNRSLAPTPLPSEIVVRGHDLIAYYEPTADWPLRWELLWRAYEPIAEGIRRLDFQFSTQTPLLDCDPQVALASELNVAEVVNVSLSGKTMPATAPPLEPLVCRLPGGKQTLIEILHPSDFCGGTVEQNGADQLRATRWLFKQHLEKGVIRRARLRVLLVPTAGDLERAQGAYEEFADEDPDLSA